MKKILLVAVLSAACAFPKGPIEIPDDRGLGELMGWTIRAEIVPMTVCVGEGDRYTDELRQLIVQATDWWNGYLAPAAGCNAFEVDLRNDTHLFCDIIVKSAPLPPNLSGQNDSWWSIRSDPPGRFYRSEITLDEEQFSRPGYHVGVLVHELGHSFGLKDDPGGPNRQLGSVMASPLPRVYRPTYHDLRLILEHVRCNE